MVYWLVTDLTHHIFSTDEYTDIIYSSCPEDPEEEVPKYIKLLFRFVGKESNTSPVDLEDIECESNSSEVEKSVTLEH